MAIYDETEQFFGLPVVNFSKDEGVSNPQGQAYRVFLEYDECEEGGEQSSGILARLKGAAAKKTPLTFERKLAQFTAHADSRQVEALVVGYWGESYETTSAVVVDALVQARNQLPGLRALFIGDMTSEQCEISWINQSDISPLYEAFPRLEWLQIRGGAGLELGEMNLPNLRALVIETGGLGKSVLKTLERANLPALEHLELWLGTDQYGWDGTLEDIDPLLRTGRFPKLRYLGLRNFAEVDALVPRLVASPVVRTVEELDLSLGNLSDEGGKALLKLPTDAKLKRLDLHHHYLSDELMAQLSRLPFKLNVDDQQEADEDDEEVYRYIAVSE